MIRMKSFWMLICIIFILLLPNNAYSETEHLNEVNIELLGKNLFYSISYQRKIADVFATEVSVMIIPGEVKSFLFFSDRR